MPKYGVTPEGFVIKRLDDIMSNIYTKLKDGWGFDPSINPQSFLSVIVTSFADEVAGLWEVGQDQYYSQYPSTAEGISLENAMQYGGVTKLGKAKTFYSLDCTGKDGTDILYGSLVKSITQPEITLQCARMQTISRQNFKQVKLQVLTDDPGIYTVVINSGTYTYNSASGQSEDEILQGLYNAITDTNILKSIENKRLVLTDKNKQSSNILVISENILVTNCTSNLLFESIDYGPIIVPNGTITEIVTIVSGFDSVVNNIPPVPGRLAETDIEARQSYIKRIALRSRNMLESITSALYNNVQGVVAAIGYENESDETDAYGRPPHSIEILVDGGSDGEIAQQVFNEKASGIQTFGSIAMDIADEYTNIHKIKFNRPEYLHVWLSVSLMRNNQQSMAPNYALRVKDSIMSGSKDINVGENVFLQKYLSDIYRNVTGISFVNIKAFVSKSTAVSPASSDYILDNIIVGPREKAVFDAARIEVNLIGN